MASTTTNTTATTKTTTIARAAGRSAAADHHDTLRWKSPWWWIGIGALAMVVSTALAVTAALALQEVYPAGPAAYVPSEQVLVAFPVSWLAGLLAAAVFACRRRFGRQTPRRIGWICLGFFGTPAVLSTLVASL